MAERWPDGSNAWQDGDVLTASDLNDTIDGVTDGIDTLGEEAQENRLLINQIQFQTSADPDGDSTNSFADIMTDSNGYRNSVSASNSVHFNSGLNGFSYPRIESDYQSTQTSISTNSTVVQQTYDPNRDEFIVITSVSNQGSGNQDISYEIYDAAGNQLRSGTFTVVFNATSTTNDANIPDVRPVSEGRFVIFVSLANYHAVTLVDHVNNNKVDSDSDKDESIGGDAIISSCGNSNNNGSFAYTSTTTAGSSFIYTASTSALNQENKEVASAVSPNIKVSGHGPNRFSGYGVRDGSDDDIGYIVALKDGDSFNSDVYDSGGDKLDVFFDGNKFGFNDPDDDVSLQILTEQGKTAQTSSVSSPQHNNLSSGGSPVPAFCLNVAGDARFRCTANNSNINGHLLEDINGIKHVDGGGLTNEDPTNLPNGDNPQRYWSLESDSKLYTVDNPSSQTVRLTELQGQVVLSSSFQYETDSVTSSSNIEYVNAEIYSKGNNDVSQFQLIDGSDNGVIGTFSEKQKVFIGDQDTQNVKIRIENSELPNKTGIQAYSVVLW